MSSEEEIRVLKQTFLREAILEAGYSPEKFIEYLQTIEKKSVDIDRWSLDELKREVKNYKMYYSIEEQPIAEMSPTLSSSPKNSEKSNAQEESKEKPKENGKTKVLRFKSSTKVETEKSTIAAKKIEPKKVEETPLKLIKIDDEAKAPKVKSDFVTTKKSTPNKYGILSATVKE